MEIVQCNISRETIVDSEPHYTRLVYKRKKKAFEPVKAEEQVENNPPFVLGTPIKPTSKPKVYIRRKPTKVCPRRLSFGSSVETKASQALSTLEAIEGNDHSSDAKRSACFDIADNIDVKEDVFVPLDTIKSSFEHQCRNYEENKKVRPEKVVDGVVSLVCEESYNVLDGSSGGDYCNLLGSCAVHSNVLEPQDVSGSVLRYPVDVKEEINVNAHEKPSNKSLDSDSRSVVNDDESAELLNPASPTPKVHHSDTASSSLMDNNPQVLNRSCFFPGASGFVLVKESPGSGKTQGAKSPQSSITEDEDPRPKGASQGINGQGGIKGLKRAPKRKVKKKSHRPKIMVDGGKTKTAKVSKAKAATLGKQSVSKKRKRGKGNDQNVVVVPETPEKQNLSKRRRNQNKSRHETLSQPATLLSVDNGMGIRKIVGQGSSVSANVARHLKFDHDSQAREENLDGRPVHPDEHENPISNEFGKTGDAADSSIPSGIDMQEDPIAFLNRDSDEACEQVVDETELRKKVPGKWFGGQTCYAIETRRSLRRSKCLEACKKLRLNFPARLKGSRIIRKSRVDFSDLVFGISSTIEEARASSGCMNSLLVNQPCASGCHQQGSSCISLKQEHNLKFEEAITSNQKQKVKRSKTTMFPMVTWKKRSKRSVRLQNGSKWAAIPLFYRQTERIPALSGCLERNSSQAKELPNMTSHIQQIQFKNPITRNGETEGKLHYFVGEKLDKVVHKAQTFSDSTLTKTSEICKETTALPLIRGYQSDGSNKNLAAHVYPVNLKQQVLDHSLLSIQNYDLVQNVGQASWIGLEPYSLVNCVKSLEHEPLLCRKDKQFVPDDFWLSARGDPLEHEGSASVLTGESHQNQLPLTLELFSRGIPTQKKAAGALYQNQFQPTLDLFSRDLPVYFRTTQLMYEDFVKSGSYAPPAANYAPPVANYAPPVPELGSLQQIMEILDFNERILDCNRTIENNGKHRRRNQMSHNSKEQLMVLIPAAQGPKLLVPYKKKPAKQKKKTVKVALDTEDIEQWKLSMTDVCLLSGPNADEDNNKKMEGEREVFRGRIDLFIKRMHDLQGNRQFKQWKGSVVDSVVGVFLTQNVSDNLSSNAFISVAAKFPPTTDHESREQSVENGTVHSQALLNSQGQMYFLDDPLEENKNELETSEGSTHLGTEGRKDVDLMFKEEINNNGVPVLSCGDDMRISHQASKEYAECKIQKSRFDSSIIELSSAFESISLSETQCLSNMRETKSSVPVEGHEVKTLGLDEQQKTTLRRNKKTGLMEDEKVDWKSIRRLYTKEGPRDGNQMDSVDWEAVRLSGKGAFEKLIKERGQQTVIARKIKDVLNQEVKRNGTIDLEWLRDAPPNLVKQYLLGIDGLGLKSVECIRLLALKHTAFPVDTNVGRIAVRLGWVPLKPLPKDLQMHELEKYPSMNQIQKYLWPRLCKLPQSLLYELHYQMITFGKVFCTMRNPNCNACPMKGECRHFASAYASAKLPLPPSQKDKTENSEAFLVPTKPSIDMNNIPTITSIDENSSSECGIQTNHCKPIIEMPPSPAPSSPAVYDPNLLDIEDMPCSATDGEIPEININIEKLRENLEQILDIKKKLCSCGDEDVKKALIALTQEDACIPLSSPRLKYYKRLRTEHVVYVLPDGHELLQGFERREPDDPSPYLLTVWQPGEMSFSSSPPKKKCNSDGSELCKYKTCSFCCKIREQNSDILRGTILIPCRTAMRGSFPLNGTYFQINEVFADQETSLYPIKFPRQWIDGLENRALYCGSSVSAIFKGLDTRRIQLCFWTGFICVRGFDRKARRPLQLVRRLHTPPSKKGKKFQINEEDALINEVF